LIVAADLGATMVGFIGMFHAAEFVSPGLATAIANAQPLIAALLGRIVLGERQMAFQFLFGAVPLALISC